MAVASSCRQQKSLMHDKTHTRNKYGECSRNASMWVGMPLKSNITRLKLEIWSSSFMQGDSWLINMICFLFDSMENTSFSCICRKNTGSVCSVGSSTLNSYDSSIMISSLECSPSTGFPISAIRLASSSSDVSFLSGTSERRGNKIKKSQWERGGYSSDPCVTYFTS